MLFRSPADHGLPTVETQEVGDRRAGVIWHTQGSGKSLLMAFYAGLLVREPAMANPTLVVLTDRNDLDGQLFQTFVGARSLLRELPQRQQRYFKLRRMQQFQSLFSITDCGIAML